MIAEGLPHQDFELLLMWRLTAGLCDVFYDPWILEGCGTPLMRFIDPLYFRNDLLYVLKLLNQSKVLDRECLSICRHDRNIRNEVLTRLSG